MTWQNHRTPSRFRPTGLAARVRDWRAEQGLTQSDLAQSAGLALKTVQRVEAGRPPSADTIWRLELALDLPLGSMVPDWAPQPAPHEASVGARIRERRRVLGVTLEQLAGVVGVSAAQLSRFERGLGVPFAWLEGRTPEEVDDLSSIPLARALGFRSLDELNAFLAASDARPWSGAEDKRSALRFPPERLEQD